MAAHMPSTILIVDDEPGFVRALARLLAREGYTVTTAANGALAWAQLHMQTFDVILCDLRTPAMDGPTFYHLVQHYYPALATHIVFLTGDTANATSLAFLHHCGQPWVYKPCTSVDVLHAMAELLHTV